MAETVPNKIARLTDGHSASTAAARTAEAITIATRRSLAARRPPVLIALDGPSGSGKSTLARVLADALNAVIVPSDDFFSAWITDAEWEVRSPRDRAVDAIDWRRMRREALEPLLAGMPAQWHTFDFEAGVRTDGTYAMRAELTRRPPGTVIILEGAYSARPELGDLIDLTILVDAPVHVRHRRLAEREAAAFLAAWHARWDAAEAHYFTHVRPLSSFDLTVSTA